MNRWQKELSIHPIRNTITSIFDHISPETSENDDHVDIEKSRLFDVLNQILFSIDSIEAEIVPFHLLDNLNNSLVDKIGVHTERFSKERKIIYLKLANDEISKLLVDIGVLRSWSHLVENYIGREYSSLINQHIGKQNDLYTNKLSGYFEHIKSKGSTIIDSMNENLSDSNIKRQNILELYEIVAGDSATSGYMRNVNHERKHANIWRRCSIGFIIATAVWLFGYIIFFLLNEGDVSWKIIPLAISLTGVLLFGAVYSGQQSSRHRNNEQRLMQMALQITAFEPFVSSLDNAEKNQLRKEVAASIFVSDSQNEASNDESSIPVSAIGEFAKLIDKITRK